MSVPATNVAPAAERYTVEHETSYTYRIPVAQSWQLAHLTPTPVGGTVVIRMRFTQFLGRYVFHCHILDHEDNEFMRPMLIAK